MKSTSSCEVYKQAVCLFVCSLSVKFHSKNTSHKTVSFLKPSIKQRNQSTIFELQLDDFFMFSLFITNIWCDFITNLQCHQSFLVRQSSQLGSKNFLLAQQKLLLLALATHAVLWQKTKHLLLHTHKHTHTSTIVGGRWLVLAVSKLIIFVVFLFDSCWLI